MTQFPEDPREPEATDVASEPAAGTQTETAPESELNPAAEEAVLEGEVVAEAEPEPDPLEALTTDEVRERVTKSGEYLELAQRTRADFDNYRKRTQRDLAAAKARGAGDLARELLTTVDNIDRALEHEADVQDEAAKRLLDSLKRVHDDVVAALGRVGITRFDPTGDQFDPKFHEAMAKQPATEEAPSGTVLVVFQHGYISGEDVLRPARVVVAD